MKLIKPYLVIMVAAGGCVPVERYWTPWGAWLAKRKMYRDWAYSVKVGGERPSFLTYWAPYEDVGENLERLFDREH